MANELKNPNWLLQKLSIIKNNNRFDIYPSTKNNISNIIEEFKFVQDINSPIMGGHILIQDVYNWSGDLNVNSFEKLIIELYTDLKYSTKKTFEFNIFSVQQVSHNRNQVNVNEYEYYNCIKIDFSTDNILSSSEDSDILNYGEDFVGYIATDGSTQIPGFINEVMKKLNVEEYEIEPTFNGVWIKSNELSYPWAKSKGQQSLDSLINYVKEYACSKSNKNAINYFFWRDVDGYHFKSVEKMINDSDNNIPAYFFISEAGVPGGIIDVYDMRQANILDLADKNTFQSFYEKISPNYDEFYLDFVDTSIGFTYSIVDFDYVRDFSLWNSIEKYKLIPDDKNTSVFINKNRKKTSENTIQNLRTDDLVYGYFQGSKLNTPFDQYWNNIGKTGDSRWDNVSFKPQFDMTELDIQTFYKIHKNIREPLKSKRSKYSYLKNLKRKWEVYRCSICCLSDRLGGIQDQLDIERLQGLEDPNQNPEFLSLFGPTGIFADSNIQYRIAAAGSFSDVYNYDSSNENNRGLTLSYDLNKTPYNESIGDFYQIDSEMSNYEKHIFTNAFAEYDLRVQKNNEVIAEIDIFLANVDGYIIGADQQFQSNLREIDEERDIRCQGNSIQTLYPQAPNGFISDNIQIVYPENSEKYYYDVNSQIINCSLNSYIPHDFIIAKHIDDDFTYCTYINPIPDINDFLDYKINYQNIAPPSESNSQNLFRNAISNKFAYCVYCVNPIMLEIFKRRATKQKFILSKENELLLHVKNTLQNKFYERWKEYKQKFLTRKAFFISKNEDKINNNDTNIKSTTLSLFNIKSITRKPIRGSRYEILSKKQGITGGKVGQYLHKIFFDDQEQDISIEGNHPYYDQKYKSNTDNGFIVQRKALEKISISDFTDLNDPQFLSSYPPSLLNSGIKEGIYTGVDGSDEKINSTSKKYGYDSFILNELSLNDYDVSDYNTRYNIFKTSLINSKPVNIRREEITSYVRIEFKTPIGIESINDFPNGFIRNAGYEYFLPYLVSLTSGPNGRQTINQNIAVIGMDPYGFDVAIKRIPHVNQDGEFYWWWNGIESPQMDLWPEAIFETKYSYYAIDGMNNKYNTLDKKDSKEKNNPKEYLWSGFSNFRHLQFDGSYNETTPPNTYLNSYEYANQFYTNDALKSAKYDKNLSETNFCSHFLLNSHKTLKAARSWWSFHIPQNIVIIPVFDSLFSYPFYNRSFDLPIDTRTFDHVFLAGARNTTGNEKFDEILRFSDTQDANEFINEISQNNINFVYEQNHFDNLISSFKDYDYFEEVHPDIKTYFNNMTNYWMSGEGIMYRPELITDDVWKYDLSGYSEYGLISPPVRQNHPDIFDNNFAAQFVVFAKTSDVCTKSDLKCINPKGQTTTTGCPEDDPYCNCPAQNRKPTEAEPSYLELYKLEQEMKECDLIKQHLGDDWLGCVWSDPNNTASCNCPEIGDKFMDYLEYNRTYATFWNTPPQVPLLRNSQINLLFSNKMVIKVLANPSIKVGSLIKIVQPNYIPEGKKDLKRFSGKYLVTSISYIFNGNTNDYYELTLNRDSLFFDPNESAIPVLLTD